MAIFYFRFHGSRSGDSGFSWVHCVYGLEGLLSQESMTFQLGGRVMRQLRRIGRSLLWGIFTASLCFVIFYLFLALTPGASDALMGVGPVVFLLPMLLAGFVAAAIAYFKKPSPAGYGFGRN
ncbi:MAG: hypothetical protein KDE28_02460 [Anaerolineales bacterium]|nr:hypothetical protein [Anaerolineales bacterium]MCB8963347.1 hypothetical protein [Ardenticatenales bacterium]